jgi:hypothetical protein
MTTTTSNTQPTSVTTLESCSRSQRQTKNGSTHLCITIRWAADAAQPGGAAAC